MRDMFSFRQQYMQIDFLRLFKLCRSLDVAKRKRKMPVDYNEDGKASTAGRRLLKSLLEKHIFPGWPKVRINYDSLRVNITREDRVVINTMRNLSYDDNLRRACGDRGIEAQVKFEQIQTGITHVHPYLPYEIRVSAVDTNAISNLYRPNEKFYECALACMAYKEVWDANIESLREFHNFFELKQDELQAQVRERQVEENRRSNEEYARRQEEQREATRAGQERHEAMSAQVAAEAERTRVGAQNKFEEALGRFRRNRPGDGGV